MKGIDEKSLHINPLTTRVDNTLKTQDLVTTELSYEDFNNTIKKIKSSRNYKITNSYNIKDYYKYYSKTIPNKDRVKEDIYYKIIKSIHSKIIDSICSSNDIKLPLLMGSLEVRKFKHKIQFIDGKLKTTLPIDWDKTIKLWYNDKECRVNKTLLRVEKDISFKLHYNKRKAKYRYQKYFTIAFNRKFKLRLSECSKQYNFDSYLV